MGRLRTRALAGLACLATWSIALEAQAGDRGLYLAFVDARGWGTEDPRRDAFEHSFFGCGEEPLDTCRATRVPGSDHDTGARPIYALPSAAVDLALVEAARHSARGRTALLDAMNDRGVALDGVVMVRAEGTRLVLVLVNLNARTVARLPLRSDGTLADGHRTRAERFFARGWVP